MSEKLNSYLDQLHYFITPIDLVVFDKKIKLSR